MDDRHQDWIAEHVTGSVYGKCAEITQVMADAFPELERVRGHYYCTTWGERTHWWLTTIEGVIVDPTASQFPSKGAGDYVPWTDGEPEPTGRCANCGELAYNGRTVCSDTCGIEYVAFIYGTVRR